MGALAASICAIAILSTDIFVMPMGNEQNIKTTKTSEVAVAETIEGITESSTPDTGEKVVSNENVIECKSIIQGAKENDLADRKLYF